MPQEDYNNARQVVVTMRNGTVHTLPKELTPMCWANAVDEHGTLTVYTEGRTHVWPIFEVASVRRID